MMQPLDHPDNRSHPWRPMNRKSDSQSLIAYLCDWVKGITAAEWMSVAIMVAMGLLLYWAASGL